MKSAGFYSVSPFLIDLSSNVIPVDDDEYEDEYDDIEGLASPPPPPSVAQVLQVSKQIRRQHEPDEDEDDIYEELPGMPPPNVKEFKHHVTFRSVQGQ